MTILSFYLPLSLSLFSLLSLTPPISSLSPPSPCLSPSPSQSLPSPSFLLPHPLSLYLLCLPSSPAPTLSPLPPLLSLLSPSSHSISFFSLQYVSVVEFYFSCPLNQFGTLPIGCLTYSCIPSSVTPTIQNDIDRSKLVHTSTIAFHKSAKICEEWYSTISSFLHGILTCS